MFEQDISSDDAIQIKIRNKNSKVFYLDLTAKNIYELDMNLSLVEAKKELEHADWICAILGEE